jgi:hypothetical protein
MKSPKLFRRLNLRQFFSLGSLQQCIEPDEIELLRL